VDHERAPDRDGDGVPDLADRCPAVPGSAELAGCPAIDSDGDGLADHLDRCPREPEDKDGFADDDGCPDPDNDGDGVLDLADRCPDDRGPADNAGCPDTDGDGDTVVDRLDRCPNDRGPADNAGCPRPDPIPIVAGRIDIPESVYFKTDQAILEPRSFPLLDNVATVMANHPDLAIQVEGHTDSIGSPAYNLDLSQRRAQSVVDYLLAKGIAPARLQPRGFGQTHPITDNGSRHDRAKNRRVVFTVVGTGDVVNPRPPADTSVPKP